MRSRRLARPTGLGYAEGIFAINAGQLTFTLTKTAFEGWAGANGLPAGQDGPADDADGDGESNLLEFVLAQNPMAGGARTTQLTNISSGGEEYPALRFTRRIIRGNVDVAVRVSTDLNFGSDLGAVEISATSQGDGTELVIVRSAVPYSVAPKQFLRIDASQP